MATATLLSDARARWRAESRSFGTGDRWGSRRVPKRRRDEGLLGPDKSLQDAVDASVIAVDIAKDKFDACRQAGANECINPRDGNAVEALMDL